VDPTPLNPPLAVPVRRATWRFMFGHPARPAAG
jgi:hypothetical protein